MSAAPGATNRGEPGNTLRGWGIPIRAVRAGLNGTAPPFAITAMNRGSAAGSSPSLTIAATPIDTGSPDSDGGIPANWARAASTTGSLPWKSTAAPMPWGSAPTKYPDPSGGSTWAGRTKSSDPPQPTTRQASTAAISAAAAPCVR